MPFLVEGLHEYANLYLCARNPMLYKRRESHGTLCVLRVSTDVLDLPGVVLTGGNAASDYTAFMYLGRIIEYGPTGDIFANPHLKETEDYITGRFG